MQLTKHFKKSELECPCCGKYVKNVGLLVLLETIRKHFRKPVTVNSAFRCHDHNAAVGGTENSQHLMGTAVDIVVKDVRPSAVAAYLMNSEFRNQIAVGQYETFTHVDLRGFAARWEHY